MACPALRVGGLWSAVLCFLSPSALAEPAGGGAEILGAVSVGYETGKVTYDGPVLVQTDAPPGAARYSTSANALVVRASLGAAYLFSEHWAAGAVGVVTHAPNPDYQAPIAGAGLYGWTTFGAAAFARYSPFAGAGPRVELGGGVSSTSFEQNPDGNFAPGLVADEEAFTAMTTYSGTLAIDYAIPIASWTLAPRWTLDYFAAASTHAKAMGFTTTLGMVLALDLRSR